MAPRLRATLIHLYGSGCVALVFLGLVFFVWYPAPLSGATGVTAIFLILLAVDVVLGPALTFVVYKTGKKSLRFDLSVIVVVQLAALCYGLLTIAVARPAWIVFNVDRFDLAQAHELDGRYLSSTKEEFRAPPWSGPRWVAARNPTDLQKRNELIVESAAGGSDLPQRPDLYVSIQEESSNIKKIAQPLQNLERFNRSEMIQDALAKWPQADAWLPLMARAKPMTVLLRKKDGVVIAVVDLRPWN